MNLDDFRAELAGFTAPVGGLLPGLRPDARGALVKWMRLRNSLLFVLDFDSFDSEEEQAGTPGTWHSFEVDVLAGYGQWAQATSLEEALPNLLSVVAAEHIDRALLASRHGLLDFVTERWHPGEQLDVRGLLRIRSRHVPDVELYLPSRAFRVRLGRRILVEPMEVEHGGTVLEHEGQRITVGQQRRVGVRARFSMMLCMPAPAIPGARVVRVDDPGPMPPRASDTLGTT